MTTLRIRKWWMVPAATLVLAIGVAVGPTEATKNTPAPAVVPAAVLIEDPTCALPAPTPTTEAAPAAAAAGVGAHTATAAINVTVTVEAVAWIELDAEGRLVAAATNTGCAPRNGDKLAVRGPDRVLHTDVVIDLDTIHWVGDFTEPGVLAPQAHHVLITL